MATALHEASSPTVSSPTAVPEELSPPADRPEAKPVVPSGAAKTAWSPATLGLGMFTASIVAAFGLTMALALALTSISIVAAFGFGLYCAFWLGIGFGTIFGAAAVFGHD